MTQVFGADGVVTPVTVVKAGPCVVVQTKTAQGDGYEAAQIGLVEDKPAKVSSGLQGHYAKANVPPTRVRREVGVSGDGVTAGQAEYIVPMASAGVAAGVDGVFMEVHQDPSRAKSDAQNALRLDALEPLLRRLTRIHDIAGGPQA